MIPIMLPFLHQYWFRRRCTWSQARRSEYQARVRLGLNIILGFPRTIMLLLSNTWNTNSFITFWNPRETFLIRALAAAAAAGRNLYFWHSVTFAEGSLNLGHDESLMNYWIKEILEYLSSESNLKTFHDRILRTGSWMNVVTSYPHKSGNKLYWGDPQEPQSMQASDRRLFW